MNLAVGANDAFAGNAHCRVVDVVTILFQQTKGDVNLEIGSDLHRVLNCFAINRLAEWFCFVQRFEAIASDGTFREQYVVGTLPCRVLGELRHTV